MEQKIVKYLDKVKGPLVKPCPGAKNHKCCNYVVISHILNCPYNCSYCFLHTFFGKDEIVVFRDEEKVLSEVKEYMQKSEKPLRFGTGEFSDSLALPDAASLGVKLVNLFAQQDKHLLELKTKSCNVDPLLDLQHKGQTVIAWSVNPPKIVTEEEWGTPSLAERLAAAKKCAEAGYKIAFHFDPLIYFDHWQEEYTKVVEAIFEKVLPEKIVWISLGALRFPASQKKLMLEKFGSKIDFSHFEKGLDNKLRYPEDLRVGLFDFMYGLFRSKTKETYIYLCMETEGVWDKVGIENNFYPYFEWQKR